MPKLASATDTRYFEDLGEDVKPLAPPEGAGDPNATKDILLKHDPTLIDVRKQTAFLG